MSYLLNGIDLSTYGILAGRGDGNTAMQGCWDLPKRSGDTFYSWGDEDGVEPFVEASDMTFEGREITFNGVVPVNNFDLYYKLKPLYADVNALTGLSEFETPFGTFNIQVVDIQEEHTYGAGTVKIKMREPVVSLTGGSYPASGDAAYTIDGIPTYGFGLYINGSNGAYHLPTLKEQNFTKYGTEGFQIVKRGHNELSLKGYIFGTGIADFQEKIKALYLAFSASGKRLINKNNEVIVECFAVDGFSVTNVFVLNSLVTAEFNIKLIVTGFVEGYYMQYEDSDYVSTEEDENLIL